MITYLIKNLLTVIKKNIFIFITSIILLNSGVFFVHSQNDYDFQSSTIIRPSPSSNNLVFYIDTGKLLKQIFKDTINDFHFGFLEYDKVDHLKKFIEKNIDEKINLDEIHKLIIDSDIWIDTNKDDFFKFTIKSNDPSKQLDNLLTKAMEKEIKTNLIFAKQIRLELLQKIDEISGLNENQISNQLNIFNVEFIKVIDNLEKNYDHIFKVFKKDEKVNIFNKNMYIILFSLSILVSIGFCFLFNEFFYFSKKIKS